MVVIVTALGKRALEDYFGRSFEVEVMLEKKGETALLEEIRCLCTMVDMCYVRQKRQLGLGHAMLTAKNVVRDEPFVEYETMEDVVISLDMTTLSWYGLDKYSITKLLIV